MMRTVRRMALSWSLLAASAFAVPDDSWIRIRSANFELFTTARERAGRDLLRHFEQVRSFFLDAFGLKSTGETPVRIIAFRNHREFDAYRPSDAATAFYHNGSEHDYIVMSSADFDQYQVATHEYAHVLIGQAAGSIPVWLNEGLAEFYSTLQQQGEKVIVGIPPAGREQALLNQPWIPLDPILAVDHDSPLYNDRSRAGMFYSESWALVHMLNLDAAYRPHIAALLTALKTADSAMAFEKTFGKTPAGVQADLQEYVTRRTLHGFVFQLQLEKSVESPEVQTHAGMLAKLALADLLMESPGKVSQAAALYGELARDYPHRWEVEGALGRFAWRERRHQEAAGYFAQAVQSGAHDPQMFVDYARALDATGHPQDAMAQFREAIRLDSSLRDAHFELGLALLREGSWREAMAELPLARPLLPAQASRYFYGMAYCAYRLGDLIRARNFVEQGRPFTKIPEELSALNGLSEMLGPPVVDGVLESVECQGKSARLHIRVKETEHSFLIPDLSAVTHIACGSADELPVRLEFQPMPPGTSGADGIVRSLEFR